MCVPNFSARYDFHMRAPLTLLLLVLPSLAIAETMIWRADFVRDGDTVVVSGVPIRLQGRAAP